MLTKEIYISPEEYLTREENSPHKNEYRNGLIYAMAGVSNNHVLISINLSTIFRVHTRGSGCLVYGSDTKVNIESLNTYYYPDVVVSCDVRDRNFNNFICYPCLIVEVLSPSTEGFDRGDKFADYRHLPSLQEYILVSQNQIRIDYYRRNQDNNWLLSSYKKGEELELISIGLKLSVNQVYEDVTLSSKI
jgi:Uma2 family endonuclease